ncbi:MAG TPA: DUF4412 domain-containing protein [Polyangiaceae bacterium]|jgi:hypothetical protein
MRVAGPFLAATVALAVASSGCNKLKGGADGGDEGGAGSASGAGGPSLSAFLNGFEGEIDLFMKDNKPGAQAMPFSLFIKSDKVRFDVPEQLAKSGARGGMPVGEKAWVLFESAAKKLSIVMDTQKQVIVIDLNKSGEQLKGLSGGGPPGRGGAPQGPTTKLTKTGKYDTVAGYKCENWDISTDHKEGTVCVAQEGVSWFSIPMTGIPTEHAWMAELMDGKHFPLRFVGYEKDGTTEQMRVEVTKIDKKTLAATEFQYPATYKVMDLSQMFQGMGGMPSGMPMPPHPPHH